MKLGPVVGIEISSLIKTGLPTKFPRDFQDKQAIAKHQ